MIKKRYSSREISLVIGCSIVVICILSFYIWHQTEAISLGYMTSDLEEEVSLLKKDIEKLETIRASLLNLERVEKIAREKLKLRNPEKEQIIFDSLDGKQQ